jgi:hypothetical protein
LGNSLFFDHTKFGDDAIVLFADPTKELHIGVLTIKFREGSLTLNDDANAYVGLFNYKTKEFGISGDVTYVDDQLGLGTQVAKAPIHFWNFGLRGNVNAGDLAIKADAELQAGKVDNIDVKFRGYAGLVGLSYKLAPVTLVLEGAYGSGDDNATDSKMKAFVTSQSAIQHFTYVYDYRTKNACGAQYGGLCNTMYLKLGANAPLAKDLAGELSLYWLQAAKKFAGAGELGGAATTSKNIGTELDARVTYKIDRNLTYWVEGGYLFAGDFMRGLASPALPASHGVDDAYTVRHGIQLSF